MTSRSLSLIDAELRSIRTIDDDARRQLADIATSISRGTTVSQYAALCDLRDRLLLGIAARRESVDRLLDERLRATEVPA